MEKILLDYTEDSEIKIFNWSTGNEYVFKGLSGIRAFFTGLFADLADLSGLAAPVVDVLEDSVFLVWQCPTSGVDLATDTFIFDKTTGKIMKQNIACLQPGAPADGPKPVNTAPTGGVVQASWDNHFAAFGAQDVPKILLDYTGTSQVTVYDATTGKKSVYTGLTEIEECFTELFAALPDLSSLGAPVVQVEEGPFGMVYLVWECPSSGFTHATDTFMFEAETGKIDKQMVARKAGAIPRCRSNISCTRRTSRTLSVTATSVLTMISMAAVERSTGQSICVIFFFFSPVNN